MYQRATNILLALSAFLILPAFAAVAPPRPVDACEAMKDRTFRIMSMSKSGYGSLSQTHQAVIEHNYDTKKTIDGPEITSCIANKVGAGCKWEKVETSPLGKSTVQHPFYEAHTPVDLPVNVTGNGCDNQKLLCKATSGAIYVSSIDVIKEGPRVC